MASSTNSWLQTNLLSQHDSQQQNSSHALYHSSEISLHGASSAHLNQSQHLELGHGSHGMEPYCQPLHHTLNAGLHLSGDSQQPVQPSNTFPGSSGRGAASNEIGDPTSARKVHKADREKLRRDRLNEQFGELAGVLDPDRPKNDKATILGDSVQVVKELRAEVKRLKCEHTSLLDESRDLVQEKTELREEKAALKTETEQLQAQLEQRLRGMLPWMSVDPSTVMMGPGPYPFPMPVAQPLTGPMSGPLPPTSETQQLPQQPVVAPSTYLSMAPPVAFMHPGMQAYAMYGTRHSETGGPFMPYAHYPVMAGQSRSHPHAPFPHYPGVVMSQSYASHASSRPTATSPEPQGVETSLQLQTPGGPSPSPPPAPTPSQRKVTAGIASAQSSGSESSASVLKSESNGATQIDCSSGVGDAISTLTLASSSLSRPVDATHSEGMRGSGHCSRIQSKNSVMMDARKWHPFTID
ncbi:unnamed protein product [Sphagnum troendelagicum]|uniref:BHLH domain-containing protein n=1 Tax=Sphagnum troendelagicum TaxID=128251 RepID=A0ABP0UG61_9BRYO